MDDGWRKFSKKEMNSIVMIKIRSLFYVFNNFLLFSFHVIVESFLENFVI